MAYTVDPQARYTESHEWVRRDGEVMVVGITDYAQHELSDVVYIELPERGTIVGKGDWLGTFESVKAAEEVYSPIGGEVVDINIGLADNPQWVNEDPYGNAWLAKIKPSDPAEFDALMDAAAYQATLQKAA